MRIISADELKEILEKHKKWLETRYTDNPEGERANLSYAKLSYANLSDANLSDANLSYANLSYANLDQKEQIRFGMILKEDMKGFKKCYGFESLHYIVELIIPKGAIVFSINNGKCRTNKVEVVAIKNMDNGNACKSAFSSYNTTFTYFEGQKIEIDNFDCRYNIECASGIHFFRTKEEAEKYSI